MRRIYRRRFMKLRFWAAVLIMLAFAAVAARLMRVGIPPEGIALGVLRAINWAPVMFAALVVAWLLRSQWGVISALDVDLDQNRFKLRLWRPFGWRYLEGKLEAIAGWHYEAGRHPAFRARIEEPPVDLEFPLAGTVRLATTWRRIAPGAVAAYERDRAARE